MYGFDSNYNVIFLPKELEGIYKIGDLYKAKYRDYKALRFHNLKIINIDRYLWCIRLHFNFSEWENNDPSKYLDEFPIKESKKARLF